MINAGCDLLNEEKNVEECDATKFNRITSARFKEKIFNALPIVIGINFQ